jgi:hypothetical protein
MTDASMAFQDGSVDFRSSMAQSFLASLGQWDGLDPGTLQQSDLQPPTYRQVQATRRILEKVRHWQECPAIEQLSQRPLRDIVRFLLSCRDLTMIFLGMDLAGLHSRCLGDVRDLRRIAADSVSLYVGHRPAHPVFPKRHWRSEERLERTFIAIEQLLSLVADRGDVAFIAAWRVGSDAPARIGHSLDIGVSAARHYIATFDRSVLSGLPDQLVS